jgi:hypothetical protein
MDVMDAVFMMVLRGTGLVVEFGKSVCRERRGREVWA